jgi:hypothetical protein
MIKKEVTETTLSTYFDNDYDVRTGSSTLHSTLYRFMGIPVYKKTVKLIEDSEVTNVNTKGVVGFKK